MKPTWKVVKDEGGWGVADSRDILENQEPLTRAEAIKLHQALIGAYESEAANQRYWSQSCFGE